ncbi:MAG: glycosyltransferase family 2 protein [Planctomycetota bacterium]|jgi:glycosyltransferase involved in cell wall biosynthesis
MMHGNRKHSGPLVSVLISTYNRPQYVCEALESILRQTYFNIEIILVRDGGTMVRDVISRFDDSRLIFIDRDENRGLAYSFNEALSRAKGDYICYLGDDDIFYPHHVEVLVNALEGQDEYEVAYSDLYKTHCRIGKNGERIVLSKNVEISRDFSRMTMLRFNHTLHVSIIHRRDLLERAGGYNEDLNVLIDWDLTRRLCFYSDFKHIYNLTGEYYAPVGDCDRISVTRRRDVVEFARNLLTIRSTRPPKPWPKVADMSIILLAERLDEATKEMLGDIWSHTFYPCQIYLPLPQEDLNRLSTIVPNIIGVPVSAVAGETERLDAALNCCEGDYVAIVPMGFETGGEDFPWIESALWALMNCADPKQAFELPASSRQCWSAVFGRDQLIRARRVAGHLPLVDSILASGIKLRKPEVSEYPLMFDNLMTGAEEIEEQANWPHAAEVFEYLAEHYRNELWMKSRWANALYHTGRHDAAAMISGQVNSERPTVSMLLLEARARRKKDDIWGALELLEKAKQILEGSELAWTL